MAKFEMRLKLTGLEIELKGERADLPKMAEGIKEQLAGLIQAPAAIAADEPPRKVVANTAPLFEAAEGKPNGSRTRRSNGGSKPATAAAVDFKHDPTKYGMPAQDWTTAQKSMFTLYAVGSQGGPKEMGASTIAATFNKHFKQFKSIRRQNVTRDLGLVKGQHVNEDTTQSPSVWHLLSAGEQHVKAFLQPSASSNVA